MCGNDYPSFFNPAETRKREAEKKAKEMGLEATYRCDATWAGKQSVLLEATRDTAELAKGEFLVISLG